MENLLFFFLLTKPFLTSGTPDVKNTPFIEHYYPIDSIPIGLPLDSGIIKIEPGLKYVIKVFPHNKYILTVNDTQSVIIPPFVWDNLYSKGIVLPNFKSVAHYKLSENEYLICVPHSLDAHLLIRVFKDKSNYLIEHNQKNWIVSEDRFLFLPEFKEIAVPTIRGTDYGMVTFFKYNENGTLNAKKSFLNRPDAEDYQVSLKRSKCIRDIIKLRAKMGN